MNILMDLYDLGNGFIQLDNRRGVFRYVENLIESLVVQDDVDLTFCCSENWHYHYHSIQYIKEKFEPEYWSFAQSDTWLMGRVSRKFYQIEEKLKRGSGSGNRTSLMATRELLRAIFKIHHNLKKDLFDTLHSLKADIFHSPHFVFMPSRVRELNCSKIFVTVHDIIPVVYPQFGKSKFVNFFKNRLDALNREDWIFTVSQFTADDLCGYADNIDPDKVIPVPLAAAGHFMPCSDQEVLNRTLAKYKIPREGTFLLSLSALEPRKNFELTINSFQDLVMQEKVNDLHLVLVGRESADFRSYLEKHINSDKVRGRIIFTGFVPDEDLSAIYSAAAAFLFPSFYEGFGLPPLEAMKCGAPVIASNRSSIPEVVGDAGILIDPDNVDDLSQAVLRVLGDSDLSQELSEKSLARAAEFSWEKHAEMTVAGYRRALESS